MRAILLGSVSIGTLLACHMAGEGDAPTGSVSGDITEDVKEVVQGVESFISAQVNLIKSGVAAEETLVSGSISNASSWLSGKLSQLSADAQTALGVIVTQESKPGANPLDTVANVLTVIYDDVKTAALGIAPGVVAELKGLESSAVAGFTALTTLIPSL